MDKSRHALDLSWVDVDLEEFAVALALRYARTLIARGGTDLVGPDTDRVLTPHHLQAFLARALESATKARRFEREWRELYQLSHTCRLLGAKARSFSR